MGKKKFSIVDSIKDFINIIIPHFNKYPFITQKRADFELFKQAVDLINRKEHLTLEGLKKTIANKASMNKGLSPQLKQAFPDVIPVKRPLIADQVIDDPN